MIKSFGTTINCMDGRVQECVNEYVKQKADVAFVDAITLAGPVKVIHEGSHKGIMKNLKFRLNISINGHGSRYIAVVGHHDCAGVIEDDDTHKEFILSASNKVKEWYPNATIEALWVNKDFEVEVMKN